MEVSITREASAGLGALKFLRPGPSAWGFLLGHRRGRRFFVEQVFPACAGAVPPPPGELDELDRALGRRVIGLFGLRPGRALKKSFACPYFYGRLFLDVRFSKRGLVVKPSVVEFEGTYFLAPAALKSGRAGGKP
jgi:hypothetical protein